MQWIILLLTTLLLSACGGSSGGSDDIGSSSDKTPDTTTPDTTTPDTTTPDTTTPDTTTPDTTTPDTTVPDTTTPNTMIRAHTYKATLGQTSKTPKQSLVSYLDHNKLLHLAWIESVGNDDHRLRYATYNQDGTFSKVEISHDPLQLIFAIAMVVDDSGSAHIVMHAKRDVSVSCCKSGNYAIYYAGNSSGSFSSQQISNNPINPLENTKSIFDAYVNGRPDIFLDANGNVNIIFMSAENTENGYDNHIILATKSGNSWNKNQAVNFDNLTSLNFSSDHELSVSRSSTLTGPFIWMDISNYNVHAIQQGIDNELTNYGGYTSITNVQSVDDGKGNSYAIWLRDKDDDVEGDDYAFYISKITANGLQNPSRIAIASTSITSNFAPAAIDPVSGKFYLFYTEGVFGTAADRHIIEYNPETGVSTETTLPKDIGTAYGRDSLWVYDGLLTYVAADSWSEIRINQLQVGSSSNSSTGFKSFPDDFFSSAQDSNVSFTGIDNFSRPMTANYSTTWSGTTAFNNKSVKTKSYELVNSFIDVNLGKTKFYYSDNNGISLEGFETFDGTVYKTNSPIKTPELIQAGTNSVVEYSASNGASAKLTTSTDNGSIIGSGEDTLLIQHITVFKDINGINELTDTKKFIIDNLGNQELVFISQVFHQENGYTITYNKP